MQENESMPNNPNQPVSRGNNGFVEATLVQSPGKLVSQSKSNPKMMSFKNGMGSVAKWGLRIFLSIIGLAITIGLVIVLFMLTDLDLQVFKLSASGQIVDNNARPIAGARIEIAEKSAITDEQGKFSISDLPKGVTTLSVKKEGYSQHEEEVEITKGVLDYDTFFEIKLDQLGVAAITGRVYVESNPDYIFVEDYLEINNEVYKLEQDGTFSIQNISSGTLNFAFRSKNYTDIVKTIELSEGSNNLGEFAIKPAGDIVVSLKSFVREEIVSDLEISAEGVGQAQITEDLENARLTIRDLEIGRNYRVRVNHPKYVDRTYERVIVQGENPLPGFRLVQDKRIAYLFKDGNYLNLFSSQLDGAERINLTNDNFGPYAEYIDTEGLVYFLSSRDRVRSTLGGFSLLPYVVPATGGNPQRLIDVENDFGQLFPSYPNDLLVNKTRKTNNDNGITLQLMTLDAKNRRQIFRVEDGDVFGIRISREGNMITFGVADAGSDNGLYAYNVESNKLNKINNTLPLQIFDISKNGDEVLYSVVDDSEELRDLYIFKQSTGQNTRVRTAITGSLYQFIQGDSNRIIFFDQRDQRSNIYTYEVSSNTEKRITNYSGRTGVEAVYQQGEFILYQTNADLFIMDPEKLIPEKLVTGDFARYTGYDYN